MLGYLSKEKELGMATSRYDGIVSALKSGNAPLEGKLMYT